MQDLPFLQRHVHVKASCAAAAAAILFLPISACDRSLLLLGFWCVAWWRRARELTGLRTWLGLCMLCYWHSDITTQERKNRSATVQPMTDSSTTYMLHVLMWLWTACMAYMWAPWSYHVPAYIYATHTYPAQAQAPADFDSTPLVQCIHA